VIVFISGVESSNGKVLFDACRQVNPRSYKISSAAEIVPAWFLPGNSVGICGATSTPMWQMEEARAKTMKL
jgi:4-hydroxy-3-methylbut-2-enyl diphosphate reductase